MREAMSTRRLCRQRGLIRWADAGVSRERGGARCWAREFLEGEATGAAWGGVLARCVGLQRSRRSVTSRGYNHGESKKKREIRRLLPNFALRSSGGFSGPWPRNAAPLPYGNVGLNQTSGRLRGLASCKVVRDFEVCVGEAGVDCATVTTTGLAARAKRDREQ